MLLLGKLHGRLGEQADHLEMAGEIELFRTAEQDERALRLAGPRGDKLGQLVDERAVGWVIAGDALGDLDALDGAPRIEFAKSVSAVEDGGKAPPYVRHRL